MPRGVVQVAGSFSRGTVVRVLGPDGKTIAHGVSNYSNHELDRIKGRKSGEFPAILGEACAEEAIHRDNLILTGGLS